MSQTPPPSATAADAFIRELAHNGVDCIFANAGSDFPPIAEALAKAQRYQSPAPRAFTVPHENVAVSMAYGHTMVSGRPQAVMLHNNVGTANAICGLFNMARERVPVLLTAGRTPIAETGYVGARASFPNWGQEMFDQAGMLREVVKWDYELRLPDQAADAAARALAICRSEPQGASYLMLPREVMAAPSKAPPLPSRCPAAASMPAADADAVRQAAAWLAAAERPVIITASLGRRASAVPVLGDFAQRFALPVVCHTPKWMCLPSRHPMHLGYNPAPFLEQADVVLVLECDVPWIPSRHTLREGAKVIHLAVDPLFERYPMRTFPADLAIRADPEAGLRALADAMAPHEPSMTSGVARRRAQLAGRQAALIESWQQQHDRAMAEDGIHPDVISRAIDDMKGERAIVLNELGLNVEQMTFTEPGTYFSESSAGGLGWACGAALGAKLAAPDHLVIATMGDGTYMFGNPTPTHFVSRAYNLPVLFVVFNNGGWAAVRQATALMYPDGYWQQSNEMTFADLNPMPDFEKVVEASGGYGERVDRLEDLRPALGRALHAVQTEGRQALLNVICTAPSVRFY